jgi:hypothetical protein
VRVHEAVASGEDEGDASPAMADQGRQLVLQGAKVSFDVNDKRSPLSKRRFGLATTVASCSLTDAGETGQSCCQVWNKGIANW